MKGDLRGLLLILVGGCLVGACSEDVTAELEAAGTLVVHFDLTQITAPKEVESKTDRYVTASGLMEGDQDRVLVSVVERLTGAGWSVVLLQPIDVSGGPATEGGQVVATKDDLTARVAVFDQVGLHPAPLGSRWVQVSVAGSSLALEWGSIDR